MPTINLPRLLSDNLTNDPTLFVDCHTVQECLVYLIQRFPSLEEYIFDSNANLCKSINIYVNNKDIKLDNNKNYILSKEDIVNIVVNIAGG